MILFRNIYIYINIHALWIVNGFDRFYSDSSSLLCNALFSHHITSHHIFAVFYRLTTTGWNNLSGTIPHELSDFTDSIVEINIGGGSISGTIPSSFEKFTKIESIGLNDHCLSGSIPEFSQIPTLKVLSIINNAELTGSLNGFCNGVDYKNSETVILGDCDGCSGRDDSLFIECDCCNCCDHDNFVCCDNEGNSWPSYFTYGLSANGFVPSFDKQCLSKENEEFIQEECPCVVNISTDLEDQPFLGECTTNCTAEGAIPSYNY